MIVPIIALILIMGVWPAPWLAKLDRSTQNFLTLAQSAEPSMERPQAVDTVPPTERFIERQEEGMGKPVDVAIPIPKIEEPTDVAIPPPPPPTDPGKVEFPELPAGIEESEEDW